MRKSFYAFTLCLFVSACAAVGPTGSWDYKVTGTPQGDFTGELIVAKNDQGYSAKLKNKDGEISFNSFTYDKKEKKSAGKFDFSGTTVDFSANMEKDQLKGSMTAGGMEFPFSASKKK